MNDEVSAEAMEELECKLYSQIYHSMSSEEPLINVASTIVNSNEPMATQRYYDSSKKPANSNFSFIKENYEKFNEAPKVECTALSFNFPRVGGGGSMHPPKMIHTSAKEMKNLRKQATKKAKILERALIRSASKNAEVFRSLSLQQRKKVIKLQKKQKYLQKKRQRKKLLAEHKIIDKYNGSIAMNLMTPISNVVAKDKIIKNNETEPNDNVVCILSSSDDEGCEIIEQRIDTIDLESDNNILPKVEKKEQDEHFEGDDDDVIFIEGKKPETVIIDLEPSDIEIMKPPHLIETPESTMDFLDNFSETTHEKFNQSIVDGIDLNTPTKIALGVVPASVDNCGSESSCSAIDITTSLKQSSFKDIAIENNLFSEQNLESFANFITPKRNSSVKAKKPAVSKQDFDDTPTKSPCKTASDTSSESEYNDSKVAVLEKNKRRLPDLSYFEDDNEAAVVLVEPSEKEAVDNSTNDNNKDSTESTPPKTKKRKKNENNDLILNTVTEHDFIVNDVCSSTVPSDKSNHLHPRHSGNILNSLSNVWTNNFDMDQELINMSDDPMNWRIHPTDRLRIKKKNKFGPRCNRCGETGHTMFRCPNKVGKACCSLCASLHHFEPRCPNKLCSQCGQRTQFETNTCPKCAHDRHRKCKVCHMTGHREKMCPDIWRRYHLTTEEGPLVKCKDILTREPKDRWCSCCGNSGHYDFDCTWNGASSKTVPYIMNYRDIYGFRKSPFNKEKPVTLITSTSTVSTSINTQEIEESSINETNADESTPSPSPLLVINPLAMKAGMITKFIKLSQGAVADFHTTDGNSYLESLKRDLNVSVSLCTLGISSIQLAGEKASVNDAAIRINDYLTHPVGVKKNDDIVMARKLLEYMQWSKRTGVDIKQLLNKVFSDESTADDVILLNAIVFGTLLFLTRGNDLRTLKHFEEKFQKTYILTNDERVQLTLSMVNFFYKKLTYDEYAEMLNIHNVSDSIYLPLKVGTYLKSEECTLFKWHPNVDVKIHFSKVGSEKCAFALITGTPSDIEHFKIAMNEFIYISNYFPGMDHKIRSKLIDFFTEVAGESLSYDCGQLYRNATRQEQFGGSRKNQKKIAINYRRLHCILFLHHRCNEGAEYVKTLFDCCVDLTNKFGRTPHNVLYKVCEAYHFVCGGIKKNIDYETILKDIKTAEENLETVDYMTMKDIIEKLLNGSNVKNLEFEKRQLITLKCTIDAVNYIQELPLKFVSVLRQIEKNVTSNE